MKKQDLFDLVQEKAQLITDLSDEIWDYAELSLLEHKSAAAYIRVLKEQGFAVEENLCGIPTAFSGSFGSGSPRIGILGEYDALSGLNQKAGATEKCPIIEGESGQGCGHNLLGAAALGAAVAIKEAIAAGSLSGTVIFYGCPGEEGCAGKTFMARDGVFRNLDAALTWHPGDTNEITTGSNAACIQVAYTFTGIAAHAAGDPFNGRSALDAAELMNVGVQFLREHMEPKCSVHYSFADAGGVSPNVVQSKAKLIYMVRGATVRKAKALLTRVDKIAQGAAMMTETQVSRYQIDGTADTLSKTVLELLLYANLCEAPLPVYSEEEQQFAQALRKTYAVSRMPVRTEIPALCREVAALSENGTKAINDFIVPYYPSEHFEPGSTDVGDVSWCAPTAQFTTATWPSEVPGHSWQIVSTGKTGLAYKGELLAAQVLAATIWDLMQQPEHLEEAKAEFAVTAAEGYDCPIGPELVAAPQ